MEAIVKTKATSTVENVAIQTHLQTLAQNVTKENLAFLAALSKKPGINEQLEKNKNTIKMFL